MISEQLVDVIRQHPDAQRYQCVYARELGPQRLGCAIDANGRDLVILTLHTETRDTQVVFYGLVETVPVTQVSALVAPDARINAAVEALRDFAGGLRESLVESRLRAWAEINQNLALAQHGFAVRIDMPAVVRRDVTLEGHRPTVRTTPF